MKWYDRSVPKISDILPHLKEISSSISSFDNVKNIYLWGSISENFKDLNFRVKDIDILIDSNFDSGDLLAIDNSSEGALKMSSENLEDMGFSKEAVLFTRSLLKIQDPSIDFWAISTDKKLLHWGPITETIEEWKQIRKDAEIKANSITEVDRKNLNKSSESTRKKWYLTYENCIHEFSRGCPQGWYASQNNVDKVLETAIKI